MILNIMNIIARGNLMTVIITTDAFFINDILSPII